MTIKKTKLIIKDEVNIRFTDLDPVTRKKLVTATECFVKSAKYSPLYKLKRWDGRISFTTIGGNSYINLLDKLIPILADAGYEIEIEDNRNKYEFSFPVVDEDYFVKNLENPVWPPKHPAEGQLIKLRDYQVDAVNNYINNTQSISEISTGAGKTIITATLSHLIEPYGRSIIIVPNKSLVEQTEEDYKNVGLNVGVFYGDRKEYDRTHTICTWQSLSILNKKSKDNDETFIQDFLKDVIAVICDECHMVKGTVLKDMLTTVMANIPIRWGLTGTIPKDDYEYYPLICSVGPVTSKLAAYDLQQQGVLSNCHVAIKQMIDTKEFKTYPDEYKFLVEDLERIEYMASVIKEASLSGNTVVLCDRIYTGEILAEFIEGSIFISGGTKSKDRKEQYDEIQDSDNKILIATFGIAAVGINLPRIFNLVLIEPGKSFVRVVQSIGRGLRKAVDKDYVNIIDICSTCRFSKRQMYIRKKHYDEAKYPYTVEKIDYRKKL